MLDADGSIPGSRACAVFVCGGVRSMQLSESRTSLHFACRLQGRGRLDPLRRGRRWRPPTRPSSRSSRTAMRLRHGTCAPAGSWVRSAALLRKKDAEVSSLTGLAFWVVDGTRRAVVKPMHALTTGFVWAPNPVKTSARVPRVPYGKRHTLTR
jgi:hypothetical protein